MNSSDVTESPSREVISHASLEIPRWKRVLDTVLICMIAPFLLPVMLVIAAFIRIVSPGPVLFKQERVGLRGQRFMCFKFRTMVVGADTAAHQGLLNHLMTADVPMEKMDAKGDPRVIRFGSLLRLSGLDELPQIFNILRGEMSLVGPRPCLPYEYNNYQPWQRQRFNSVPGLTGLWQVSGKNRTTFAEMIQLDIEYSKTQNVWLDLSIIARTIPALYVQMQDARKKKRSLRPDSIPWPMSAVRMVFLLPFRLFSSFKRNS
jgi:lipopolysaccharide/colanic/teichoic acid biosynthesis glycosyltransferase